MLVSCRSSKPAPSDMLFNISINRALWNYRFLVKLLSGQITITTPAHGWEFWCLHGKGYKKKTGRKWRRDLQNALRSERQLVVRVLCQLIGLCGAGMRAEMVRKIRETNLFSKNFPSKMEMLCEGSALLIIHFGGKMDKMLTFTVWSSGFFFSTVISHWIVMSTEYTRDVPRAA